MTLSNYDPNVVRSLRAIEKHSDVTSCRFNVKLAELRLAKLIYTAWTGTRLHAHLTERGREVLERTNA